MYIEDGTYGEVTVHLEGEAYESDGRLTATERALCDVFLAFADPLDLCNEGAPVSLGNAYAQYEFTALVDGLVYTYPFGPREFDELMAEGEVTIAPNRDNHLPDMPEYCKPAWLGGENAIEPTACPHPAPEAHLPEAA